MKEVASSEIAAYSDLVRNLAYYYTGWAGAELDDLEQEGRISVWQALANGVLPSERVIRGRMLNLVRYLRRIRRYEISVDYETLLDLDPRNYYDPDEE